MEEVEGRGRVMVSPRQDVGEEGEVPPEMTSQYFPAGKLEREEREEEERVQGFLSLLIATNPALPM